MNMNDILFCVYNWSVCICKLTRLY